jgi:hypothetical protein
MREGRRKMLTARIVELHRRGKRPVEIQKALGVSRGMVAGILYRFRSAPPPKPMKKIQKDRMRMPGLPTCAPIGKKGELREVEAFTDEPKPLGDVEGGCRWIHGPAPGRNFCGAPQVLGGVWCGHHRARVYVKVVVRK